MAGVPVLAAVSAPSSLAVELADSSGLTLVGFLRGPHVNVYTRGDRISISTPTGPLHPEPAAARAQAAGMAGLPSPAPTAG